RTRLTLAVYSLRHRGTAFEPDSLSRRARLWRGDLGAADEAGGFIDDQTGSFDVAVDAAAGAQLATFRRGDVAFNGAVDDDGFGSDLALDLGILTDSQPARRFDLAVHVAVDQQLFRELHVAFDGNAAR